MNTKQQLINALVGLGSTITEAMDQIEGFVPCGHPALVVVEAVNAISSGADKTTLAEQLDTVDGFIDHVAEHRGVTAYHGLDIELAGAKAELFGKIADVTALMKTAGVKNTQVNEWVYRNLAAINLDSAAAVNLLEHAADIKNQLK